MVCQPVNQLTGELVNWKTNTHKCQMNVKGSVEENFILDILIPDTKFCIESKKLLGQMILFKKVPLLCIS